MPKENILKQLEMAAEDIKAFVRCARKYETDNFIKKRAEDILRDVRENVENFVDFC